MPETVSIPSRFNGPLESANGGYCSGVVAGYVGGAAEVSLRRPVPLDTPLEVARDGDGSVSLLEGDAPVAEGRAEPELEIELPAPVTVDEARRAADRYRGLRGGVFSCCFVCGLDRGDAFGVFAGAVEGRGVVASPWVPPSWAADEKGNVLPEIIWAVLDCPTFFAAHIDTELSLSVLARLTGRIDAPVPAGEEHVVVAWPIDREGRKRRAGSAVLSADGRALAVAHALLIEPRAG